MFQTNDLATLVIRRVIFHDVPNNPKKGSTASANQPLLSEDESRLDPVRVGLLKTKLTQVLGSRWAYTVRFKPTTTSPVPEQVRLFTLKNTGRDGFVTMTQKLAHHLFGIQHGGISPGLLCAMDVAVAGRAGIVLMKLEREEGAQLRLADHEGKKAFDMSVLDDLVLTRGTRLFKTVLFVRTGREDDDFRSSACDSQTHTTSSDDMARFWLYFLGCELAVEPRIATERFYDSAVRFINDAVTDPVYKDTLYDHLQSQMKAPQKTFSPRSFIQDYVEEDYHAAFIEHLKSENVFSTFKKDTSDIRARLRTSAYLTERGVRVSVSAENSDLVAVSQEKIVVNDSLLRIDRK